jgi:hypothetical protein
MNTSDFINNAEYLIRQCLNQTQIDPLMKAWLQDACLDLAKARQKDIRKTDYNSFDDKEMNMTTFDFGNGPVEDIFIEMNGKRYKLVDGE